MISVRSGIRTHAHGCGLRPERSALDHSAILTLVDTLGKYNYFSVRGIFELSIKSFLNFMMKNNKFFFQESFSQNYEN